MMSMRTKDLRFWISMSVLATTATYCLFSNTGSQFVDELPWLYFVAWLAIVFSVVGNRIPAANVFKPSSLLLLYVSTFFLFGALSYRFDLVFDTADRHSLYAFKDLGYITAYILSGFMILLAVWRVQYTKGNVRSECGAGSLPERKPTGRRRFKGVLLSVSILFLCTALKLFELSPGFLDPAAPFVVAALYLSSYSYREFPEVRIAVYALLTVVLASVFYDDRRLVAFLLFTLFFMEYSNRSGVTLSPGVLWKGVGVIVGFVALVVGMSIVRGVGGFGVDSLFSALANVTDYFRMENSLAMLFHNLEFAPTFFHTYDAVQYCIESGHYLYGETIVKVLFLLVPREAFEIKPDSMVHLYTSTLYPDYRYVGGSWVPNIFAEAYWNFGYVAGLAYLAALLWILDLIYLRQYSRLSSPSCIEGVLFLSCYYYLVFLFRGSGIDLFMYYCALSYFTCLVYRIFGEASRLGRRVRWQ